MENTLENQSPVGMTLKEWLRIMPDQTLQGKLQARITQAEAKTGHSFSNATIRSTKEMGDAAARCHLPSGHIELREDAVTDPIMITEDTAHVLIHEAIHADGQCPLEGIAERKASRLSGHRPVEAYAGRVKTADTLAEMLGERTLEDTARGIDAQRKLIHLVVNNLVLKGVDRKEAQKKAEDLVQKAA